MIYCILLIPFLCFSAAEIYGIKKIYSRTLLFFLASVLIFFIGLRYRTGEDWYNYLARFNAVPSRNFFMRGWEIGYLWLNVAVYYTIGNYYAVQFIATFLFCVAFYRVNKQYSLYPIFTLSLFYILLYTVLMCQVRQQIAIAIVLLSTKFIFEHKFLPFFCFIGLACLFHTSAITAIPLYFLYRKTNKIVSLFFIAFSSLFYFFNRVLISLVSLIVPFLPGRLSHIGAVYLASEVYAGQAIFRSGIAFIANILLVIIIVTCIKVDDNKRKSFFLNCLVLATCIKNVSAGLSILERLQSYYLVYGIIIYAYILRLFSFRKIKNIFFIYMCFVFIFFILPFAKPRLTRARSPTSGIIWYDYYNPYYNVLYYPSEADMRKAP
jgi:hypothetical protein